MGGFAAVRPPLTLAFGSLNGEEVLTENDVVQAVAKHLGDSGFEIKSALSTLDRGIDIVAEHSKSARRILVEAKGETSSKAATARYGKPFDKGQAVSHISRALFTAVQLREKHKSKGTDVAMAFPDEKNHRALVDGMRSALSALGIRVFFVKPDRKVEEYAA